MAFSLLLVAREANQTEASRTKSEVASAIKSQVQQIIDTANDNAVWDDAARAVYTDIGNQAFFWNAWGVASAEEKKFETIAVVDQGNRSLIQYRKGRALRSDLQFRFGESLAAMITKSRFDNAPTGGIVSTSDGLMLIAAAPILPTSAALDSFVPPNGALFLVVAKPLNETSFSTIARELRIQDLDVSPSTSRRTGIDIRNPIGVNVATLSWNSLNTGYESLVKALPLIAFVALIHIFFALILVRRAYASMKLLEKKALIDSLSKLPNRRAIRAELDKRLVYGEKVALSLIDLDGFKAINDNFGHAVGDRLIVAVAEMLTDLCGKSATVARLGGDEFAILVSGYQCVEKLESIAQQILVRMAHPFRVDERTVIVGASIGLASASLHDFSTAELMRRSDVAMYAAKRAGKMRMGWYDEVLDQRQATARTIESELRASIEQEAFDIVYQPVVSATSLELVGVEALLRWVSPTRGDIGPAEFIPVAEETGLIDRIGMIALRKVCKDAFLWNDIDVSINISVAQIRNPEFAKNLALVLNETGFSSDRILLDISEEYMLYDSEISNKTISDIRKSGVRICVDNYGTGRTTLSYLRQFNIDKIKIDGSLIANACNSDEDLVVLNSIAAVAKALGVDVSAEGVETPAQAELVKLVGCGQLQGWLFSREISASEVSKLLEKSEALPLAAQQRAA